MNNIPVELDLKLQEVQADLISSFARYNELSQSYAEALYLLEFTPDNSQNINSFLSGLTSMKESFNALFEATKLVAEIRGVTVSV